MERQISFERGRATTFDIGVASSTTGAPLTGKAKADFNISKDGGAFAALNASSTVTEIANGFYKITLDATTDATCDRFIVACVAASIQVSAVIGASQWEFSKVRIESSVTTANGNLQPTDAPLFIKNNASGIVTATAMMLETAATSNYTHNIYLAHFGGWGAGVTIQNSAKGVVFSCATAMEQAWGTRFVYITGTPGAAGGKLVEYGTLGGTAPTGPIFDFGASMTAAKVVDFTSTPASSAPVVRFTSGGAGPAVEFKNTSTGPALNVANSSSGDSITVSAAGAGTALKISNASTGDALAATAAGAGTAAKISNTSTGIAANILSNGAGDALKINNTSTGNAVEVVAAGAGIGVLVNNSSTGDAVKFTAAGASAYALNLDMGTAGAFGVRLDAAGWPETTGAVAGLDFFGAVGRMLADHFNVHSIDRVTQTQTTTKRDGVTTLNTRTLSDDGTTQIVGDVA